MLLLKSRRRHLVLIISAALVGLLIPCYFFFGIPFQRLLQPILEEEDVNSFELRSMSDFELGTFSATHERAKLVQLLNEVFRHPTRFQSPSRNVRTAPNYRIITYSKTGQKRDYVTYYPNLLVSFQDERMWKDEAVKRLDQYLGDLTK
jgi:hypothetical protein